ncbi:MAG: aminodeoxychorismate lyase [Gammaproteobacteria bacterium]|nr:aminodeoxychorismate lyase [Gammaproteobacteria bacterium]
MTSWIDGVRGTRIDWRDRGLQYGDGLFETLRVREGRVRLLEEHLERLCAGARRLAIALPSIARLRRELAAAAAGQDDAVLKLIVTRGRGERGYRPTGRERATRILSRWPAPPPTGRGPAPPITVRTCRTRLGLNPALAGLKTLNRLESVIARAEWRDPRIAEGLMLDVEGHVVCGTMSNLFVRHGTALATPRLDRCGVAGVMRRFVLAQARALGLQPTERRIGLEDLASADEAFITNAVAGPVPIGLIRHGRERWRPRATDASWRLRERLDARR